MGAGLPLVISGTMTPPADRCGQLDARPNCRVIGISGMVTRDTMAVLTLNTGKQRSDGRAGKASSHVVADRVAGETRRVGLLVILFEDGKRLSMRRFRDGIVNRLMAFDAVLPTRVVRSGAGDPKQGVVGNPIHDLPSRQVGSSSNRLPVGMDEVEVLKQLIVTGRPVPRHGYRIGSGVNSSDKRRAGHATGNGNREMLHILGVKSAT